MMIYRHHSYIGDGYNDVDILLCGWLQVEKCLWGCESARLFSILNIKISFRNLLLASKVGHFKD